MSKEENILNGSKKTAIVLIISIIICLGCLILGQVQAIADFSYRLHEVLYIPVNIGIFLIPVEAIFFIYFFIRFLINLKKDKTGHRNIIIPNLIALICLVVYFSYFMYISNGVQTTGIYDIVNKEIKDNNYYIIVDDKKLSCSRNEYNLITEGKKYLLGYKWNKYSPQKGTLKYIEAFKTTDSSND